MFMTAIGAKKKRRDQGTGDTAYCFDGFEAVLEYGSRQRNRNRA